MRATNLLKEANSYPLERSIKATLTLLELLIVLFLLVGLGSLGLFSSITFWRKYQLDQCVHSLTHFLEEVEMLGTLTQAQLQLSFESSKEGVWVHLKGCTPLAFAKGATTLLLPGIERVEIELASNRVENGTLIWMNGQNRVPIQFYLVSPIGKRELRAFLPVSEQKQLAALKAFSLTRLSTFDRLWISRLFLCEEHG